MRAWIFQDAKQLKKRGPDKTPWAVGWRDDDDVRHQKTVGAKSRAERLRDKIAGELAAGLYEHDSRKSWKDFRAEFERRVMDGMDSETRRCTDGALRHFERITRPRKVGAIKSKTIADFVAQRRTERGRKRGDLVSPATVNKELRHIKAVLGFAHEWEYLPKMPKVRMLKEPHKLPTYVTPDHFTAMYQSADVARMPVGLPYAPADWWRALLAFNYMTGWRVCEPLSLLRADVDLDTGYAITRHGDNKGRSDERVPLSPVVVEHLRTITSFHRVMFPWHHNRKSLWEQFHRIQRAAGIHLPCHENHEHTPCCHVYGFHDLRRAFATLNAPMISADELQRLMRHKAYATTQKYINMADHLTNAVGKLFTPAVLKGRAQGGGF